MPVVTVLVRSAGRSALTRTLASIARQDHAPIAVVVVDTTGGTRPPLPRVEWREGHHAKLVGTGWPLSRPGAANLGLDHVEGDFFCWLDEDDTYEPGHLSSLVAAATRDPEVLAFYTRALARAGREGTGGALGQPFNRALMHYVPLFHPSAALFHRRAIDLGCRFDERFDVFEDRDFVAQVAEHSDLRFVPSPTFTCATGIGASSGEDGTGRDDGRRVMYESLLRAKWSGPHILHTEVAAAFSRRGVAAYAAGRPDAARAAFAACLASYPGDPSALHGLARLALDDTDYAGAEAAARAALEFKGHNAEFRRTLAAALAFQGRTGEAAAEARQADHDAAQRATARQLRAQRADPAASRAPAEIGVNVPSRLAPCPCDSGKRYRDCCGRIDRPAAPAVPPAASATGSSAPTPTNALTATILAASEAFHDGEALAARNSLEGVDPAVVENAAAARQAAHVFLELGGYRQAVEFLLRAARLDDVASVGSTLATACFWLFRDVARASLQATLEKLVRRIDLPAARHSAQSRGSPTLHLVATLATIGGTERRALELFDLLRPHADVRLWSANGAPRPEFAADRPISVLDPGAGLHPASGTVVFSGQHFDWGEWLPIAAPERVVIGYNLDQPEELTRHLVRLENAGLKTRLQFTFPSELARARSGLPGEVDRAMIDLQRFRRTPDRSDAAGPLVIGRHSRDDRMKHHPNDPSFFRRLAAAGHRVRLMGGLPLAPALARAAPVPAIELIPSGSLAPWSFLQGLDCFVYRKHPQLFETGGTVIYEAMATELPVVAFAGGCGALEVIDPGRNGFIVDGEDEALAIIDRLARDPPLRRQVGRAARESITAVMAKQRESALDFYLERTAAAGQ